VDVEHTQLCLLLVLLLFLVLEWRGDRYHWPGHGQECGEQSEQVRREGGRERGKEGGRGGRGIMPLVYLFLIVTHHFPSSLPPSLPPSLPRADLEKHYEELQKEYSALLQDHRRQQVRREGGKEGGRERGRARTDVQRELEPFLSHLFSSTFRLPSLFLLLFFSRRGSSWPSTALASVSTTSARPRARKGGREGWVVVGYTMGRKRRRTLPCSTLR
jgi:hypothetical protein